MSGPSNLPARWASGSGGGGGVLFARLLTTLSVGGWATAQRLGVTATEDTAAMVDRGGEVRVCDAWRTFGGSLPAGTLVMYAVVEGKAVVIGWVCS